MAVVRPRPRKETNRLRIGDRHILSERIAFWVQVILNEVLSDGVKFRDPVRVDFGYLR